MIWAWIDRDKTPEHPKLFNVSAYPSLITIGPKQEKIHRFSGFRKAEPFAKELIEALRRHALFVKGEEWDRPDPRPEAIASTGTISTFAAPSEERPCGMVVVGERLWIAQMQSLFRVNPATGEVDQEHVLPESISDLCSDGKRIFAVTHGWTAGLPIHVIDPATGKETGTIVTEANKKNKHYGAQGIAWQDGRLAVLSGMEGKIEFVDPKNGEIGGMLQTDQRWLGSLDFDGTSFISVAKAGLVFIDPKTGKAGRTLALNYPVRSVAFQEGSVWLMEQPVMDFDKEHKQVQIWPKKALVYKLRPEAPK